MYIYIYIRMRIECGSYREYYGSFKDNILSTPGWLYMQMYIGIYSWSPAVCKLWFTVPSRGVLCRLKAVEFFFGGVVGSLTPVREFRSRASGLI